MPILKVGYNKTTHVATVVDNSGTIPAGSVNVGTFNHPDVTYPDSLVIYHGVRDLLNKRSAKDPAQPGGAPINIQNMQAVSIVFTGSPRIQFVKNLEARFPTVVPIGADVVWEVLATGGKAPLTYAWYWNETKIDDTVNASAKTSRLVNHKVEVASSGQYWCEVTDAAGTKVKSKRNILAVSPGS